MNVVLKHNAVEESLLAMAGKGSASDSLREFGLPTRRVEAWHYTDLRRLLKHVPARAEKLSAEDAKTAAGDYPRVVPAIRLPLFDGQYLEEFADELPAGCSVSRYGGANGSNYAKDDAIGLLQGLMGAEGVQIEIDGGVTIDTPIGMPHTSTNAAYSGIAHSVSVGKGAKVSLIERYLSPDDMGVQVNAISHLNVGEDADVTWVIIQEHGNDATHLAQLHVSLATSSKLTIIMLNCGGKLVRQEIKIAVEGENSELNVLGVNLVGGESHVDVTTIMTHTVEDTASTQLYRNVATSRGHGVFQGQIKVAQAAQRTDAKMACNTLLLSDDAEFSAKPELEIFADDVLCGHGATVTDINDDHLFYLNARGIPIEEARALLIKAFVDETFEDLADENLEKALIARIDTWLQKNGS
ncbi:MAG: Fe-S cluster assembly protein SufD [Hyphomicrobiales bacterium]|nr:MAG: Fe-S cluster assembly protein SufD [Hyphomicrobiales bacterium]